MSFKDYIIPFCSPVRNVTNTRGEVKNGITNTVGAWNDKAVSYLNSVVEAGVGVCRVTKRNDASKDFCIERVFPINDKIDNDELDNIIQDTKKIKVSDAQKEKVVGELIPLSGECKLWKAGIDYSSIQSIILKLKEFKSRWNIIASCNINLQDYKMKSSDLVNIYIYQLIKTNGGFSLESMFKGRGFNATTAQGFVLMDINVINDGNFSQYIASALTN